MASRATLFGKPQIIQGDKTSHGGVVISGSATNTWHGIPIARKTDKVYCPKCKPHYFEISEGLINCTDSAAALPMATEGHLTSCGALLIAEAANPEVVRHAMRDPDIEYAYDQHFQVLDEATNKPSVNRKYKMTYSGGEIESTTDEHGLTAIVKSETPETVKLDVF